MPSTLKTLLMSWATARASRLSAAILSSINLLSRRSRSASSISRRSACSRKSAAMSAVLAAKSRSFCDQMRASPTCS